MEPERRTDQVAHAIIGASIEVHRALDPGFRESVYEAALAHELRLRSIPFVRQQTIPIAYKGVDVGRGRTDFIVDGCVVVDVKATDGMPPIFTAQVIGYLKASGLQLGLLINFNEVLLKNGIRRVVLS